MLASFTKRFFASGLSVALLVGADVAGADGAAFDGKWRQGPLREDYTVQQWLAACGPSPRSGVSGGGEIVEVRTEGDELAFLGGGRVYRTNQCYDPLPSLGRDMHSRDASGRSWRTRCTTPASEPRKALLQTLVAATSDAHLELKETGRYEVVVPDGRCVADIVRSRSFDLVQTSAASSVSAAPVLSASAAPRAVEPVEQCVPGEAARLEVRPSRKLLRTGETFTFRAQVVDQAGCPTRTGAVYTLASEGDEARVTLEPTGKVSTKDNAPEGEVEIIITAAGKTTRVVVEVASAARYDELLTRSGLNSRGENENAAVAIIGSVKIGASDAKVEDGGRVRRAIFVCIIGSILAALGVAYVVISRRTRRAKELEAVLGEKHARLEREAEERKQKKREAYETQLRAHEESVARLKVEEEKPRLTLAVLACPACAKEYPDGAVFCPADGSALATIEKALAATGKVCPGCGRGYAADTKVCSVDGEDLIPFAVVPPKAVAAPHAKICPTCGDRFEGTAGFCGKDGTVLVLLN